MSDTYTSLEDWIQNLPEVDNSLGSVVPDIKTTTSGTSSSSTDAFGNIYQTNNSGGNYHVQSPNPHMVNNPNAGPYTITTNNSGWAHIEADDSALRIRTKDGEEITGEEIILMKKFLEKDPEFQKFKKQDAIKKALKEDETGLSQD